MVSISVWNIEWWIFFVYFDWCQIKYISSFGYLIEDFVTFVVGKFLWLFGPVYHNYGIRGKRKRKKEKREGRGVLLFNMRYK